ncbi:MAG: hypothetical protein JKY96_04445 [Phycisphaerales bacterium]|nr:hypothetical protein [Phycisphaerales bacterium]
MAITEVGNASAGGTGTAVSVTHGQTILAGDVITTLINCNGSGTTITDNNSGVVHTKSFGENGAQTSSYAIYERIAGSSEPAAFAFTLGSSQDWSVITRVFRGVHADVWDVAPAVGTRASGTNSLTATAPTITTVNNNALGLLMVASDSTGRVYSAPSNGYGGLVNQGADRSVGSAFRTWATAGATGASSLTLSASDDWIIHQIALKPASSGSLLLQHFNNGWLT